MASIVTGAHAVARTKRRVDVLLVCSSGGHLLQLVSLADAWDGYSRFWVSNDQSDARSLLRDEQALFLPGPASRSLRALARNLWEAVRLIPRIRPSVVITTGADIAVPFAWVGRLFGARVVYVESLTRIEELSLTGRLIAPVADALYVQWPELAAARRGARYAGSVIGDA
jgi:beta-1,4-N-acetylglucosaminyltransferase